MAITGGTGAFLGATGQIGGAQVPFTVPETGERAVMGVWVDITARKQAEEARRASEERYRALFENAPDGIVMLPPPACSGCTRTT